MHVISISRANNVAIMLTAFADWDGSAIRAAVLDGSRLGPDKLSLLLQVSLGVKVISLLSSCSACLVPKDDEQHLPHLCCI